jgi:hypothetical protein
MGIEPTPEAWEAAVLPLNYTRPIPSEMDTLPLRGCFHPLRVRLTDLSHDRLPRGSQPPFGVGRSFHPLSLPLQEGIRFFRDPLPTQVKTNLAVCRVPLPAHPFGLTTFRSSSKSQEDSALSPVVLDVSVPLPSRENTHHVPFGSSLSVALACSALRRLTAVRLR